MFQLQIQMCVLILSACCLPSLNAATCEETETSQVKLDLAKKSLESAKSLNHTCEDETIDRNCSIKDKSLAHLNVALALFKELNMTCHACPDPEVKPPQGAPTDCSDIQSRGVRESGVYQVYPRGRVSNESIDVYCDMKTAGGGWTVFQRRGNYTNQTDFDQDWETYKHGFGDLQEEFWLGNENILALTRQGDYSARFDLFGVEGDYAYVMFDYFSIRDEEDNYTVSYVKPGGNATDKWRDHMTGGFMNESPFSTKDRGPECTKDFKSGFWFGGPTEPCHGSNLNGVYLPTTLVRCRYWWSWKISECLYGTEMKIKRMNI